MTMPQRFRRLALTTHVTTSLGWVGAVVAYLALAIAGLTSRDAQTMRAAYLAMELVGWAVIVPCSIAALISGLVEGLGTEWGLFRFHWVQTKLALTVVASVVLLVHMRAVQSMATLARHAASLAGEHGALRTQLVVHAAGGLVVLLATTVLSFYKPWGKTAYGRRETPRPTLPVTTYVIVAFGVVLVALVVHHVAGGGSRHH